MKQLPKLLIAVLVVLLTACGGSSGGGDLFNGNNNNAPGTDSGGDNGEELFPTLSNNTYYPLNLYYSGDGYVDSDSIDFFMLSPFVQTFLIAPVNANTLAPAQNPKLSDYELLVNELAPEADENTAYMQKIEGLAVQLHTALIIDASASSQSVDKTALVNGILEFVDKAQSSTNPEIKNQQFSLWVFGEEVRPLLGHFTQDRAVIANALNGINWESYGAGSAVYQSIVAAVGYYEGNGSNELNTGLNYKLQDPKDPTSDPSTIMLVDGYTGNIDPALLPDLVMIEAMQGLNLSNLVLFASGGQNHSFFNLEAAQTALTWQSFLVFDEDQEEDAEEEGTDEGLSAFDGMSHSGKPLYYVAIGDKINSNISSLANLTIDNTASNTFAFADRLITEQVTDLAQRARLNNAYIVRVPFFERDGEVKAELKSQTNIRDYSLSFTWKYAADASASGVIPQQSAKLEITGANNEYFAGRVSASKFPKLYPAARWDAWNEYQTGHQWTVDGAVRPAAADGSITISASDVGKFVTLTTNGLSTDLEIVN